MPVRKSRPPETLGAVGSRVWRSIVGKYDLRPDELLTLEDVCALSDMTEALSDAWAGQGKPMTTKGSMGQQVTHPLISEIRTHRAARNALWRQLKLPDDEAPAATNQHRDAADTKWAQRGA